jgi:hypothetical protein
VAAHLVLGARRRRRGAGAPTDCRRRQQEPSAVVHARCVDSFVDPEAEREDVSAHSNELLHCAEVERASRRRTENSARARGGGGVEGRCRQTSMYNMKEHGKTKGAKRDASCIVS